MNAPSPFVPDKGVIRSIVPMAHDNYLFEFSTDSKTLSSCLPGQFVQLWVPGVGECPISICSGQAGQTFQLMVRRVGRVTNALFSMAEGDWIGLRGPYGYGFPVEKYLHKNICLIAGGLGVAPIRSLWQYILNHRDQFGRLIIIYGMRHSNELLFREEFKWLLRRRDIEVYIAAEDVIGPELPPIAFQLGRVTDMIKAASLTPDFQAAICGPPVMYKYALKELHDKGIVDDNIWVSLERHMKCGIGKCGHCFIGGRFDCKAGPVFQLSNLVLTSEVIECYEAGK